MVDLIGQYKKIKDQIDNKFVNKTIELDAYYNETVQEPVSESEQTQSFDFS